MAHQNNTYNGYNNYSNRDELLESQRKSLSELNKSEDKLKSDIRFGISVIIVVVLIILIVLGILLFGRGSKDTKEEEPVEEVKDQTIGNDNLGYLTVPGDWKQYVTLNSNAFMYSDPTETYIVALDSSENNDKTIDQIAEQSAKNMTGNGFKEVSSKKDKIGTIDTYRIDAFSINENKWVMNWIFLDENNKLHIISFETPNYDNEYTSIPQTFRLKNETNK